MTPENLTLNTTRKTNGASANFADANFTETTPHNWREAAMTAALQQAEEEERVGVLLSLRPMSASGAARFSSAVRTPATSAN